MVSGKTGFRRNLWNSGRGKKILLVLQRNEKMGNFVNASISWSEGAYNSCLIHYSDLKAYYLVTTIYFLSLLFCNTIFLWTGVAISFCTGILIFELVTSYSHIIFEKIIHCCYFVRHLAFWEVESWNCRTLYSNISTLLYVQHIMLQKNIVGIDALLSSASSVTRK
jgi:hypothetical protein